MKKAIKEGLKMMLGAMILTTIFVGIQMLSNYTHYGTFLF